MTQENSKQLLLKDLCARLPYGVIVNVDGISNVRLGSVSWYEEVSVNDRSTNLYCILEIKPYLFPLSSMTEEEKLMYEGLMIGTDNISYMLDVIDWLNSHHFDYRGLIEKGLAIDATGLNIYWIMTSNDIEKSRDTPLLQEWRETIRR